MDFRGRSRLTRFLECSLLSASVNSSFLTVHKVPFLSISLLRSLPPSLPLLLSLYLSDSLSHTLCLSLSLSLSLTACLSASLIPSLSPYVLFSFPFLSLSLFLFFDSQAFSIRQLITDLTLFLSG